MSFDYFLCDCVSNRIVFEKCKLVETMKKKIHTIIFHILSTTLCFLSVSLSIIFVILSHTLLSLHTNYTNMIFVWKSVHCHARHLEIIKGCLLDLVMIVRCDCWQFVFQDFVLYAYICGERKPNIYNILWSMVWKFVNSCAYERGMNLVFLYFIYMTYEIYSCTFSFEHSCLHFSAWEICRLLGIQEKKNVQS